MDGIAEMIHDVQVEATFPGRHQARHRARADPWRGTPDDPRRDHHADGEIELNEGASAIDAERRQYRRPADPGRLHYHFFETNPALRFDREKARGMRLDIAAGTAVRFEPGQTREVPLVPLRRQARGLRLPQARDGSALMSMRSLHHLALRLCRHVRPDHRRPRPARRHRLSSSRSRRTSPPTARR